MDDKDPLDLSDGGGSMLQTTSEMGLRVTDVSGVVHSMSDVVDNDDDQPCIVVVPVEEYEASQVIDLGEASSAGLVRINQEEAKNDDSQPYDPVTQSWFTTKYSKDSLSEQGHKWKQGMWSRDEIELLEQNIEEYVKENHLSDATEVIFNSSKDNRKNFYRKIAKGLQRPLFAVYRRVIRMYDHKNHVGRYSAEDIKKLKELRARHGNDWSYIGAEMGRSASSVKDKFRLLKDSCNKGKWTVDEEVLLADAVFALSGSQPGDSVTTGISWSQVADRVGSRTEKQCRAKWLNYLNWKQTGGSEWSRPDDLTLLNRIGETGANIESELDWVAIAKNWKSVRSPQWLRSKWWSLKRQVPGYETMPIKALLEQLKLMHSRRRLRDERSTMSQVALDSQACQIKNNTLTLQFPLQGQLEGLENGNIPALMLPQSALASLTNAGAFLAGHGLTTVHEDNHIIIQVASVPGADGDSVGADGGRRQIIITARHSSQEEPSLAQVATAMCADDMHVQQVNAELSNDSSTIVHSGDDLQGSSDHMTSHMGQSQDLQGSSDHMTSHMGQSQDLQGNSDHMTSHMGQSQVSVVEEQPISSQAQLIGTDAVLPQQSVSQSDLVGGAETEATLVIVNAAPSTEELSQPTTGTVEDSQLGGGVFTLAGPLPVLQTQGEEHNLMGSPGHLDTLQHHHDDVEEDAVHHIQQEDTDAAEEEEEQQQHMTMHNVNQAGQVVQVHVDQFHDAQQNTSQEDEELAIHRVDHMHQVHQVDHIYHLEQDQSQVLDQVQEDLDQGQEQEKPAVGRPQRTSGRKRKRSRYR